MKTTPRPAFTSLACHWERDRSWLAPLLALFLVKGVLLALIFAPFTGHDEVDHFFYIQRLARGEGLGVFGDVLLPPEAQPYQNLVADFPYNAEVIQPPLYHLLLAPVYAVLPGGIFGKLLALRLTSVLFGTLTLLLAYAITAELFPDEVGIRTGATAFMALQPQFSFEAAIVNHDILVILLATLAVWLAIVWTTEGLTARRAIGLGVIAGFGMLTKVSFGLMVPVLLCVLWRFGRRASMTWRDIAVRAASTCAVALLVASPWFLRSLWLYGDPTGAEELRSIPGYGEQAQPVLTMLRSASFWQGRLEDFWGNYGWRLIPFDPGTYRAIYWAWCLAGAGLIVAIAWQAIERARGRWRPFSARQIDGLLVMAVWVAMMIVGVLYVGTIQFTQSRFAFPGMAAFALLTAAGCAAPWPLRLRWATGLLIFAALLALDVVTFVRFIAPFYAGKGGTPAVLP